MYCKNGIIIITSLGKNKIRHYQWSLHYYITTFQGRSGIHHKTDLRYRYALRWQQPVVAELQWSVLLNDDNATDRRTDLRFLTRYGFPIQCLVWFLFTKFVPIVFSLLLLGIFSTIFSKQEFNLTYFTF